MDAVRALAAVTFFTVFAGIVVLTAITTDDTGDRSPSHAEPEGDGTPNTQTPSDTPAPDASAAPLPPPGDFPATAVAAREDGRLVVIDTTSGEVLRTLTTYSDLREEPAEGGHFYPIQVAVSTEGDLAYIEYCCEPAGGYIEKVWIDGADKPVPMAEGYGPSIAPHSRRFAYGFYTFGLGLPVGDRSGYAALKPNDGSEFFTATSWIDDATVAYVRDGEHSTIWLHDVAERSLKDDRLLAEPTNQVVHLATRRDRRLLWVSDEGEAHVLDPASGAEVSAFELGPVLDIAYDPSGTWLLVCTEDHRLKWYGGGGSGTIPGSYVAAGW